MRALPHGYTRDEPVDAAHNAELLARMPAPVDAFYAGFLAGDNTRALAVLDPAAVIRFPSYPPLAGLAAIADYFAFQSAIFASVEFQIVDVFSDGAVTTVIWREVGTLASGAAWRCHGVDTLVSSPSGITRIEVGGPAWMLRDILPRFTRSVDRIGQQS